MRSSLSLKSYCKTHQYTLILYLLSVRLAIILKGNTEINKDKDVRKKQLVL